MQVGGAVDHLFAVGNSAVKLPVQLLLLRRFQHRSAACSSACLPALPAEKGIKLIKGDVVTSLEGVGGKVGVLGWHGMATGMVAPRGRGWAYLCCCCWQLGAPSTLRPPCRRAQVTAAALKSGGRLEASLVLVGVGARPNTDLLAGQLELVQGPPGGIKVNSNLQVRFFLLTDPAFGAGAACQASASATPAPRLSLANCVLQACCCALHPGEQAQPPPASLPCHPRVPLPSLHWCRPAALMCMPWATWQPSRCSSQAAAWSGRSTSLAAGGPLPACCCGGGVDAHGLPGSCLACQAPSAPCLLVGRSPSGGARSPPSCCWAAGPLAAIHSGTPPPAMLRCSLPAGSPPRMWLTSWCPLEGPPSITFLSSTPACSASAGR